jgi:hypothetical protein
MEEFLNNNAALLITSATLVIILPMAKILFGGFEITFNPLSFKTKNGVDRDISKKYAAMRHLGRLEGRTMNEKIAAQKQNLLRHKQGLMFTLTNDGKFEPDQRVLSLVWPKWERHVDDIIENNYIEGKFRPDDPSRLYEEFMDSNMNSMLNILQQYRREDPTSLPDNEGIRPFLKKEFASIMLDLRSIAREKDKELSQDSKVYTDLLGCTPTADGACEEVE